MSGDPIQISLPSRDRYHSLAISDAWNLQLIRRSKALVVGAGALGNEVTKNLAMMGVRLIVVVDGDVVEASNLTRSVFFRESDQGRPKVECLADQLRDLNPDVEVLPLHGRFAEVVGLGLLRRMDMIFSCLDNRLARVEVNAACQKVGKPWVDGAMENLIGEATAYLPDEGPCYWCNLPQALKSQLHVARSCRLVAAESVAAGKVPTTSTMGSIVAAMQVQVAIKIAHGGGKRPKGGTRFVFNCLADDFYTTRGSRNEDCQAHTRFDEPVQVSEWSVATTTARDILNRTMADTGHESALRLGRNVILGVTWSDGASRDFTFGRLQLLAGQARNDAGEIGEAKYIHTVSGTESYADWPLTHLAIPPGDILEVRTASGPRFYEVTGDIRRQTEALQ